MCVEGEMDESGYYQASFGGLTGLLPANFIQETEVVNPTTRERLFNQVLSLLPYKAGIAVFTKHNLFISAEFIT